MDADVAGAGWGRAGDVPGHVPCREVPLEEAATGRLVGQNVFDEKLEKSIVG